MRFIHNPKDFYAGLMFMSFGITALVIAWSYPLGTAARMGPGYFPRILGILLITLGSVLCLTGFRESSEDRPVWHLGPVAIVLTSVLIFSLLAQWLGMIIAALLLVFIASSASVEFRWKEALLSGFIQGIVSVAVFIYGLGLPVRIWPVFIGGA